MNIYRNNDIKVVVHIREGKYYDITNMISTISWSGDIKSPTRTLEFTFIQAVNDSKVKKIGIVINSTVCFYVDSKEIFRGQVIDVDTSSTNNHVQITCKDIGFFLTKDEISYNFKNVTTSNIAKSIFQGKNGAVSLPYGKIAEASTKQTKMFIGVTRYDAIMTAYTEHSKVSGKKYMIEVDIDKFNVIEKGIVILNIEFDETKNLIHTNYKESIDKLINRVLVVDESGNKIKLATNSELRKLYKYYITKVVEQRKDEVITDQQIKSYYSGIDKRCSLSGYGDITCKAGYKVCVKDSFTGLVGEFYIDSDKHTWTGGKYDVSLDLNFDNIMDEKSSDNKDSKNNKNMSATGVDWGHGVTVETLNKILKGPLKGRAVEILRLANAYGFNPLLALQIMKMESKATFDSGLAKKYNNFGGIGPIKGYKTITIKGHKYAIFPDISTGLEEQFRLLGKVYVHDRKKTSLESILNIYAPSSDGNDTKGYIHTMKKWYKEQTGKDWSNNMIGPGVGSVATAKKRIAEAMVASDIGTENMTAEQSIIVNEAYKMIGRGKYTYGGRKSINKTDCSGFIWMLHKKAGISIGSATASQRSNGKNIPLSDIKPGDFIVMDSKYSPSGSHVVLYVGNGKIIHNGGPAGKPITMQKLYTHGKYTVRRCWG